MNQGFSASRLLLLAIGVSFASSAVADNLPKPRPVAGEIIQAEVDEWVPLPVPRPEQTQIAEVQTESGPVELGESGYVAADEEILTATTTVRMPSGPQDADVIREIVRFQAKLQGVPVALAEAVVTVESRYDPMAEGSAGEIGLMQIKPDTARLVGFSGPESKLFQPATNIHWGMRYLAEAQRRGGGTICGTILKYNAGHGAKKMNPISAAYCEKVKALLRGEEA